MSITGFDDLLDQPPRPISAGGMTTPYQVIGTPVTAEDIQGRLIAHNYDQLSDGDDAAVLRSIAAAEIHAGTIMARLGRSLDLDVDTDREVTILLSIYEMYLRVGQGEAGREYRIRAKDLIIAAYGSYPESDAPQTPPLPVGALTKPTMRGRLWAKR